MYFHFESKEGLARAVIDEGSRRFESLYLRRLRLANARSRVTDRHLIRHNCCTAEELIDHGHIPAGNRSW